MWAKRWSLIGWMAFLLSILLAYTMYRRRVMHPHFFPLCSLFLVQVVSLLAAHVYGIWQIIADRQRLASLGWLLLSIVPVSLWGWILLFGLSSSQARNVRIGLPIKMSAISGAAILDGMTRLQFRHRLEGERCVMIYNKARDPAAEVAAMDRHIQECEQVLGKKCKTKVHWIRGSVMGIHGRYFQGLSLGSEFHEHDVETLDASGLTSLDKHEVAHFVLHHQCGPDSEPPSLLIEGWAETQSGYGDEYFLANRLSDLELDRPIMSLQQLTTPDWYNRMYSPVYNQGGPLVEYLISVFGVEKFFDLYTTCRRDSFESDVRRILGVSLDQLDHDYRVYFRRRATEGLSNRLANVRLNPGVDRTIWKQFATEYPDALRVLKTRWPAEPVTYQIRQKFQIRADQANDDSDKKEPSYQTGERHRKVMHDAERHVDIDEDRVVVASPEFSFSIHHTDGDETFYDCEPSQPLFSYLQMCNAIVSDKRAIVEPRYSTGMGSFLNLLTNETATVSSITSSDDQGEDRVAIRFSYTFESETTCSSEVEVTLLPDRHWALVHHASQFSVDDVPTSRVSGSVRYYEETDPPIPEIVQSERVSDGQLIYRNEGIVEIDRSPMDPAIFTPQEYGYRATPAKVIERPWYVKSVGVICIAAALFGTVCLFTDRCVRTRSSSG